MFMKISSVVLVGRGAVGTVYAAAMCAAEEVRFRVAVDPGRLARYRSEPFLFNNRPLELDYFVPSAADAPADLVILATKWSGYAEALALVEPLVGPSTLVLPLLNGLSAYSEAVQKWGEERVLRGFYIGHTASRDSGGNIRQSGNYLTVFGEERNAEPYSPRVEAVKELFDRTGVRYRIAENTETARWQKWILNIGTNQPTALYNMTYGELMASDEAMELAKGLMAEAGAVAAAVGVEGAEGLAQKALESFSALSMGDYSSMAQDVRAGRTTEVDLFAGEVVRLGRRTGIATPRNQAILEKFS